MTPPATRGILRFNHVRLDLERGRLIDTTGAERPLRHKCFALLRYLAENAERVVSREELLDAIWPGIFVGDDSVTQCIAEIRRALGDPGQLLLRTVPKRGYVLAAPTLPNVDRLPVAPPPAVAGSSRTTLSVDEVQLGRIAGTASCSADKIEAFLESYLVSEHNSGIVPFGGRDQVLEGLDAWLDDPSAEPRLLLVAPAGRGKSAVLAQWAAHLSATCRIGENEAQWRLVFVPISLRFGTSRPAIFLEAVAAGLTEILGVELPLARTDPAEHYAANCRRLLTQAASQQERILIVLDGIDEAGGGPFDASWFPRRAGSQLRMLLSARQQIGDRAARDWVARLGWDGADRVRVEELSPLAPEDVLDLLKRMGGPPAAQPAMAVRLHDLTEGEPLLLRLHVEDLNKRAEWPKALDSSIAPGLRGYFDAWLGRQREAWAAERNHGRAIDEALLDAHLAVLSCAHGPLSAEELVGLVRRIHAIPDGFRVERALDPLRRFIIGADRGARADRTGYVLSHPRFGEFLREEYLDTYRVAEVRRAFSAWGREALSGSTSNAPVSVSPYLLQFVGQHFEDAGEPAAVFLKLVEEGWLRAWETFEGSHRGFAADVRRALHAIAGDALVGSSTPWLGSRFRCAIVLSSLTGMCAQVPAALLVDCVAIGIVSPNQALPWLAGHPDRLRILVDLAPLLPEALLPEAVANARAITAGHDRAEALSALAEYLPPIRREAVRAEALDAAKTLEEGPQLVATLVNLADRLPEAERSARLADALTHACATDSNRARAEALVTLAVELPEHLLDRAIVVARALPDSRDRARAVGAIAARLCGPGRDDGLAEALTAARSVTAPEQRVGLLAALAPALSNPIQSEVFAEALAAAAAITDGWRRAEALTGLAAHLPQPMLLETVALLRQIGNHRQRARALAAYSGRLGGALQVALLAEAFESALAIGSEEETAEFFAELAPVIPLLLRAQVLAAAGKMVNAAARALVLVAFAEADPGWDGLPERALAAAREVDAAPRRAELLMRLAQQSRGSSRADLLAEAFTAARMPLDEHLRAEALTVLADHVPKLQRAGVLSEALTVARGIAGAEERAEVLAKLAGQMPRAERGRVFREALAAARTIREPSIRASRLSVLATLSNAGPVSTDRFEEAITAARSVRVDDWGGRALALASVMASMPAPTPADLISELLELARIVKNEGWRATLLTKILEISPSTQLIEILAIARAPLCGKHRDDLARANLLLSLSARLTDGVRRDVLLIALDAARAVRPHQQRADVLGAVADALQGAERPGIIVEALAAARAVVDGQFRTQALVSVATRLLGSDRETIYAEALAVAIAIADDWGRAAALAALGQNLPAMLLPMALSAARVIRDERQRIAVLAAFATSASGPMRDMLQVEALSAARAIADSMFRAEALTALVGQLDRPLQGEALHAFVDCAGDLARPDLLAKLPAFLPVMAHLDIPAGLEEVYRALRDVGDWLE